ncbi:MAG: hypothetical protein ACOCUQ_01315 [Bacteroidota bacterium]
MNLFTKLIILVFPLLAFISCDSKYEDCTDEDYRNCNTIQPEMGFFVVQLQIDDLNPEVVVRVYEGDFENDILIHQDTLSSESWDYYLPVEKNYSFTATYNTGNSTLLAIDGGKIDLSSYTMCEYKCYKINEPLMDLRPQ